MNTKGIGGPKVDWTPWAELATQVQELKSKTVAQGRTSNGVGEAKNQAPVEETAFTKRMQAVLARHPNLLEASPDALKDAAATATKLDTLYAPIHMLAVGLKQLGTLPTTASHTARYSYVFAQLENVERLRDALDVAGSALAQFPKAQLDALEKTLRSELAALGEEHGSEVRSAVRPSQPLDRTFSGGAQELFEGLRDVLATLGTHTPHELLMEPALRNFGDEQPINMMRTAAGRTHGGMFGLDSVVRANLVARARETGEPASTNDLVSALFEHDPANATWGDVVYAFLRTTHPNVELERRPREKTVASLLTPTAHRAWQSLLQTLPPQNELRKDGAIEKLAKMSAANDHCALTAEDVLKFAADFFGADPNTTVQLNRLALESGLDPFVGVPPKVDALRRDLKATTKIASEIVASVHADLAELATTIGSRRRDVQTAMQTATQRIGESDAKDVPKIVAQAREVLESAQEDATGYRKQLGAGLDRIGESLADIQKDLRSKLFELRAAIAPIRGELDAAPTPDGLAFSLDRIERNAMQQVEKIDALILAFQNGQSAGNVRMSVAALETDVGNSLVQVLRLGARHTKTAEVRKEQIAAAEAAQKKRDAIVAEPLTLKRMITLPLEDLGAYQLHGSVTNTVAQIRQMRLEPELTVKVLEGVIDFGEKQITLRRPVSPLTSAVYQMHGAMSRVGMGVSPKQAIDWINANVSTLVSRVDGEADRAVVEGYASRLVDGLSKM